MPDDPRCPRDGRPLRRCAATDPKCGPQFAPYYLSEFVTDRGQSYPPWRGPHGETGETCLRPDAPRYPLFAGVSQMLDACHDDGECVVAGCGDLCLSYARPVVYCDRDAMLRTYMVPSDAGPPPLRWCGCVDGRCAMFTQ